MLTSVSVLLITPPALLPQMWNITLQLLACNFLKENVFFQLEAKLLIEGSLRPEHCDLTNWAECLDLIYLDCIQRGKKLLEFLYSSKLLSVWIYLNHSRVGFPSNI